MNTLLGELATLNDVQYPRYRIALKLRKLQKDFLLDYLDVSTLQEALHLSGVGPLLRGAIVPLSQLHSSISELYSCLRVVRPVLGSSHIKQAQELCYNWLQMNYQCSNGGKIDAISLKTTLCLLSGAKCSDKARYLFSILASTNGAIGRCDLSYFCTVTQQLAGTLHEQLYSEWEGPDALWLHCLKFVRSAEDIEDDELDGGNIKRQWISQFEFTKLFTAEPEPKFLTWLTLYRSLPAVEKVVHPVRCAVCTRKPMVSFRYQCTQCNNFNLCQMCFLKGRVTGKHEDTHSMVEFGSSSKQSWHHRLMGANGKVRGGRVWDEPKAAFIYNGRSSMIRCDSPMSSIQDMLTSSQQHNQQQRPNSVGDDHTHQHRPTMIRIGSQDSLNDKLQQPHPLKQTTPLSMKRGSAGTLNSSNGSLDDSSSEGNPSISNISSNSDIRMSPIHQAKVVVQDKSRSHVAQDKAYSHSMQRDGCYNMSPLHRVKVAHSDGPMDKTRSHSMQHEKKEEDLKEVNRRLSLELDMLLNDLPAPPPATTTTTTTSTAVKSYKIPIFSNASPLVGGAATLLKEGHHLEGQVSDLTERRGQLAGELEGLISQVQGSHVNSLSLSRRGSPPGINPIPLVGPSHSRSDSLPAEAYLMSSPVQSPQTYSPLINRKAHEPSVEGGMGHRRHGSQQMTSTDVAQFPDPMVEYHHKPSDLGWNQTAPQPQVAW